MKLIVGLGNPGSKYANTRHNVGFWVVDAWAADNGVYFEKDSKFKAEIAKVSNNLRLVKPQTYMNLSGESVVSIAKYFNVSPDEILVIHDEIDLPVGVARAKIGGGNAGHNGLKSITGILGTPDFWRIRLGVGRPSAEQADYEVADYVLGKPRDSEVGKYAELINEILEISEEISSGEMEDVKQHLHKLEKQLLRSAKKKIR